MNPELHGISTHMLKLARGALCHATRHSTFAPMLNESWPELSVLQAAHSAELFIKARIAEEHPLLIFEELPKTTQPPGSVLELRDLFERGRTLQWTDLPDRLWAVTGIKLPNLDVFKQFGRLRNGIQHFSTPHSVSPAEETSRFLSKVVDPFINDCWGLYVVDHDEDEEPYIYLTGVLARRELEFRVSPEAAAQFEDWHVDWSQVAPAYANEMRRRVKEALEE